LWCEQFRSEADGFQGHGRLGDGAWIGEGPPGERLYTPKPVSQVLGWQKSLAPAVAAEALLSNTVTVPGCEAARAIRANRRAFAMCSRAGYGGLTLRINRPSTPRQRFTGQIRNFGPNYYVVGPGRKSQQIGDLPRAEGTETMQTLIVGRDITWVGAFT
jgi:hypothetical protein